MAKEKKAKATKKTGKHLKAVNPFENPEAAAQEGTEENLAVLKGNEVELPEEESLIDAEEAKGLIETIKTLYKTISDSYWSLSQHLARAHDTKAFRQAGYETFEDFTIDVFGENKRKSYYLIQIHKYFNETLKTMLGENSPEYKAVIAAAKSMGWTKAMKLATAGIITPDNAMKVVQDAQDMTVKELEVAVKSYASDTEKEDMIDNNEIKNVPVRFQLMLPQKEDLDNALAAAEGMAKEGAGKGELLSLICRDFLTSHRKSDGNPIEAMLAKLEAVSGLSLIAVDDRGGKVIYGESNLQRLAGGAKDETVQQTNGADTHPTA